MAGYRDARRSDRSSAGPDEATEPGRSIAVGERGIRELLAAHQAGDEPAFQELMSRLYDDLRRLARQQLKRSRFRRMHGTTSVVNEAYLRLVGDRSVAFAGRRHFLAIASRTMRRVLVDESRRATAAKRGGGLPAKSLEDGDVTTAARDEVLIALECALERLADFRQRQAKVVEYRFFGGFKEAEIARLLGVTTRTVERDWAQAKAWLANELAGSCEDGHSHGPV